MPTQKPMTVRELIERLSRDYIGPDSPVEVMRVTVVEDGAIETEASAINGVGFHDEDDHVTVEIGDPLEEWGGTIPAGSRWRDRPPML